MQNSSLYTIKLFSQPDSKCQNTSKDKKNDLYTVKKKLHKCLNILLQLHIFKNTKENTSKDAKFIALHDEAILTTRLKCQNTSNDKKNDLYAVTKKLHKCLKNLLQFNIFKITNKTHQKMQNFDALHDEAILATRLKCQKTSNDNNLAAMHNRTNCISV